MERAQHPDDSPPVSDTVESAAPADENERLASHGLISTASLAEHYRITPASARKLMSDHGISEVRGYPADRALGIVRPGRHPKAGPGRGHRKSAQTTEHGDAS